MEGTMKEYEVTEANHFFLSKDQVTVEISNLASGWHWRLVVNGEAGRWGGNRADLLYLNGYAVVSQYFEGVGIVPEKPFLVTYLTEDK
jgi:hypothetical protein